MCDHTEFNFVLESRVLYAGGGKGSWVDMTLTPIMRPVYQTFCDDHTMTEMTLKYSSGNKLRLRRKS